jgi:tripartite-type tricarboxylate transporter receptor subunit TctC
MVEAPMTLQRRRFLQIAASAAALPVLPRIAAARADAFPSRPVRWIVGFEAGGGTDVVARLLGQWLSERTSQQFIIENRPGAASNIATETVVRAPPDGYTILLASIANATNAALLGKSNFNFIRDIAPVAGLTRQPQVLVINPTVPAKTVPELVAYAKANPGRLNMASSGTGGISHLAGELFNAMAGINLVHVPYRGSGPSLTAALGAQVEILFTTLPSAIAYVRSGQLRGLAVTSAMRSNALPDIPTIAEFFPGYEASSWYGVGAPKATPAEVIDKLNNEINAGLSDPKLKARLFELGSTEIPGSPAEFGKLIIDETEKWAKVIKSAGIKPE